MTKMKLAPSEPTDEEYLRHAELEELLLFADKADYLAIANGVWELFITRLADCQDVDSKPVLIVKCWKDNELPCFNTEWKSSPIRWQEGTYNLYTTPQLDRVAELEALVDIYSKQIDKNIRAALNHNETVRELEAKLAELQRDADRLKFISETERTVAGGKWSIQVISKNGKSFNKYFEKPPLGDVSKIHIFSNKLEALREAIDAAIAIEGEKE